MSKGPPHPFPAFAVHVVWILAVSIAHGFRYSIRPKGKARVTAYRLAPARETARRYSRRVIEVGPPAAFHRQRRAPD